MTGGSVISKYSVFDEFRINSQMLRFIKTAARRVTLRTFSSATDAYKRGTAFARINGFFRRRVIQFNNNGYIVPMTSNPFHRQSEPERWSQVDSIYEYPEEDGSDYLRAENKFKMVLKLIENRVTKDQWVFDVGCNSGYVLGMFHDHGYSNLCGVDPVPDAIAYAHEKRPYLSKTVKLGPFGPKQSDMLAHLITFFDSADRIPYDAGLFEAIDRCSLDYVVIGTGELNENFPRNWVYEMSRKGFICLEKRVVDSHGHPIGDNYVNETPLDFWSLFLFRRIEPRALSSDP